MAKAKKKIKLKLPKLSNPKFQKKGKDKSRAPKPRPAQPSPDRMANAPRDPNTGRPTDPNTGQPIPKRVNTPLDRKPKKTSVGKNHLRLVYQITNVEEAKNEEGVIVRKLVDAAGPRGASLSFEVNDPAHHDMLQSGSYVSVEVREVSGHNA